MIFVGDTLCEIRKGGRRGTVIDVRERFFRVRFEYERGRSYIEAFTLPLTIESGVKIR